MRRVCKYIVVIFISSIFIMKVYVLEYITDEWYWSSYVVGVYDTEEKAKDMIIKHADENNKRTIDYNIEEYEVE